MGMPRIEIEFEFDMVFCLALYAVCCFFFFFFFCFVCLFVLFSVCLFVFTRIYFQHIARPVESDRAINIVFVPPSVHPFFRSQFMNLGP